MTVERTHELVELDALLAECAGGRGRTVLVTGPLAGGKTELLDAFGDRAARQGATVLSAAASRAEQGIDGAVAGQLVPALVRAASPEASADDLAQEFCRAVLDRCEHGPVVVTVDDVQHLDPPSLDALFALLRRVRSHPILVLLSTGTHYRRTAMGGWTALLRHPHLKTMRLRPFPPEAVTAMLTSRWGEAGAAHAPAYHAATGGSSLLLRALLDDAPDAPPPGDADTEPVTGWAFRNAVLACLDRGEPMLLATAQGIALLGPQATPETLGLLLGLGAGDVIRCRDILDQAGLLHAGAYRHPAARRVVLDALGPTERADLQLRAAELAHEGGADCTTIAGHLVAAGRAPHDWAPDVLVAAAEQAFAVDRVDEAGRCVRLALAGCRDTRRRAALTATLARTTWWYSPAAVVRHLDELRTAASGGLMDPREQIQLVRYLTWHGRPGDAAEVLSRLDARADGGSGAWLAEVRAVYRYLHHSTGPLARQLPGLRPAPQPAEPEEVVRAAERLLTGLVLEDHTVEAVADQLAALAHAGRADRAAAWCDALVTQAAGRGAVTAQAQLTAVRAELSLRLGDLPTAVTTARRALDLLPPSSWGVAVGSPLASLVLALVRLSRLDEAAEHLRLRVPEAMFDTRFGPQYLQARGHHHLAGGRAGAAYADFQRCGELIIAHGPDLPAVIGWRADLALAHLALDRPAPALELATQQLDRLAPRDARTRGATLRVLAAASDARRRPALLREAVDLLQTTTDQVELVSALVDLSDTYHRLGEFSRARMTAQQARQRARAIGAEALCADLLSASTGTEAVRPRPDAERDVAALSDAEWRVASLAALGHTNVEIGRKLFITVSTVEQHLTRVYRKLKVARRGELPTILLTDAVDIA